TPEAQPIPEPEPVPFEELQASEPPPEAPPPKRLRRVHGLSASSFSTGSGTGLSVRAGTTLSVAASDDTLTLDEASESVAITEVTTVPRLKYKPALEVPDTVKEAEVEGVVHVRLVLDKDGRVSSVKVTQGIGHGADEACADAWRRARFKPATRNGESIGVTDYPQRCVIKALD
ncbi:MAG: energy transducer TonB, partial [Myxococcota bacterium]|nr:energy transducer TonB [Myxococcota bacterium]